MNNPQRYSVERYLRGQKKKKKPRSSARHQFSLSSEITLSTQSWKLQPAPMDRHYLTRKHQRSQHQQLTYRNTCHSTNLIFLQSTELFPLPKTRFNTS